MEKSEKTAVIAISMNVFLFLLKASAALFTGSIALKAETFHTLSDVIASITVFVGLKIAKRKTKSFPYGLYKLENLLSVLISLVILYTGYEIAIEAISSKESNIKNTSLGIVVLLVAMIITFIFSRYEKKIGESIHSPILKADAEHIKSDMLSNGVVLIAMIAGVAGYHVDKIAALIVVVFLGKTGLEILKDGVKVLLDASVDYETLSKTEKIIMSIPQVTQIKSLTGRNSGRFQFIEASVVIQTHDFDKAHLLVNRIEKNLKEEIPNIDHILIHYEPVQKKEIVYAIPLTQDQKSINSHLGDVMWFLLLNYKKEDRFANQVQVIENPFQLEEKGKGILVAEYLVAQKVDVVILKNDFSSKGPAYVFSDSNIEVRLTEENKPELIMKEYGLEIKNNI